MENLDILSTYVPTEIFVLNIIEAALRAVMCLTSFTPVSLLNKPRISSSSFRPLPLLSE